MRLTNGVLWLVGSITITVIICTTALILSGKVLDTGYLGMLSGLVVPIILTVLGIQNNTQSGQIDEIRQRIEEPHD